MTTPDSTSKPDKVYDFYYSQERSKQYGFCIIELHNGQKIEYVEMIQSANKPVFKNSDMTFVGTFKESEIANYDTSNNRIPGYFDDSEYGRPSSFNYGVIDSMRSTYYGSDSCSQSYEEERQRRYREEERERMDRRASDEAFEREQEARRQQEESSRFSEGFRTR